MLDFIFNQALLILVLLPLAGFVLVTVLPVRFTGVLTFLIFGLNLLVGVAGFSQFKIQNFIPNTTVLLQIIPDFGIGFNQSADMLGWLLILATSLCFVLVALFQIGKNISSTKFFFNCLLILQSGLLGLFSVTDMILFYLFLELTLLPVMFLIGKWSDNHPIESALWFLIYTLAGSFLLLATLLVSGWLYQQSAGTWSFNYWDWYRVQAIPAAWQMPLLIFVFLAFAVKLHLFPLHSWLPKVTAHAPAVVNVLLMGVLITVGTFGMWRLGVWLLPLAWAQLSGTLLVLAVIGILYAAGVASAQNHIKLVLTYAAISHAGFILLGLSGGSSVALNGAVLQTFSDAINFGALFLMVGMLADRGIAMNFDGLGGLAKQLPYLAGYFLLVTFAVLGLPGLNSFVGEFLILLELFKTHWPLAILASTALIWGAVYMLGLARQIFWGTATHEMREVKDLSVREHFILLPLITIVLWMGVCPGFFLDGLTQNIKMLEGYKKTAVVVKAKIVKQGNR